MNDKLKKILAYVGNFVFGGMPAVIDLWVTEKDVAERTDKFLSRLPLGDISEENDEEDSE